MNIPERGLEPPEDRRKVVAECPICGEPIHEYDDCYDIPDLGLCCTRCIEATFVSEVTID